jgi:hypothetical protein
MASLSLPMEENPAAPPSGGGLLDQLGASQVNAKIGGGMLDAVDPRAPGIQVLPGRP